jgi:hypothetical protein
MNKYQKGYLNLDGLFPALFIAASIIGWCVIEALIWIVKHIHISWIA